MNKKEALKKLKNSVFKNRYLLIVVLVAFIIRVWGIKYGLPQILNLDEPSFVRTVKGLNNSLDPMRFDWPHTSFYLHFVFYVAAYLFVKSTEVLGFSNILSNIFPLLYSDPAIYYFISRFINALMGALTVFPVYLLSLNILKSKKLSLLTALLFAVIPLHVMDSHRALLDTSMTFWVTWFAYFSSNIIKLPTKKNFILSGVFMGLAFGTKYNALLYYVFFMICLYYSFLPGKALITYTKGFSFRISIKSIVSNTYFKYLIYHFTAFFTAYLITNPTVVTNFNLFWSDTYGRGFLFQFENVGNKTWFEYPGSLFENIYSQALVDYGLTLYLVIIAIFITYIFFNFRDKVTNLTVLFPLLFYFYISQKDRSPSHYFVFLTPLITIAVVYFLYKLSEVAKAFLNSLNYKVPSTVIFYIFFTVVLASPAIDSFTISKRFSNVDTRVQLLSWLSKNAKDLPIYIYGEQLYLVDYGDLDVEKINYVDYDNIRKEDEKSAFYLVIGIPGISEESLLDPNNDVESVEGGEQDIISISDYNYKVKESKYRIGPSIYVFKVPPEKK